MDQKISICIPARYNSTRLPGKPLLRINGKSIIQRVYENAIQIKNVNRVVVLTDDERIKKEITDIGGESIIITDECLNGTDRIIKYLNKFNIDDNIIVNVQGDEPFLNPHNIELAIQNYIKRKEASPKMVCSTLYYETLDKHEISSKNRGKSVMDNDGNIMYCSRNVIPSGKKDNIIENYKYRIHIGIFVYDREYLLNSYATHNTNLQLCEDIEWLKIIEDGYQINAVQADSPEIGVDTIEDFEYLTNKYK
ncbi:3-deoxy-D-manno-octulosonate cytidylyltransferase [Fadolivirus algeromassiliense]|jgi:3-deoxy-manno-octulosonate cytidylyltransferase (CMP-KDO synthetase)|uniref:3-deoxy-D-manno-octulosonate cytidylyltransferase n=1 Tax=Fadolivirus FV1/VV64 TaxID=3070911 RepID=A0A7D3UQC8_9VIRU|nr:3-deoxy-D-manno-octulosonate cytidylyltransferase [Fadolivirus algeromassiliense]QKF94408.1 3-deoxy-D-manno-octulosonate cytidylyltransferase [Fadolivirus FV1/VV64]